MLDIIHRSLIFICWLVAVYRSLLIRKPRLGCNLSRAHCQLVKFTKSDLNSTASSYHSFTKLNCFDQKHFWMMLSAKEIWTKFNCIIVSQFGTVKLFLSEFSFKQNHFWMMLSAKEIWNKFNCIIVSQFGTVKLFLSEFSFKQNHFRMMLSTKVPWSRSSPLRPRKCF